VGGCSDYRWTEACNCGWSATREDSPPLSLDYIRFSVGHASPFVACLASLTPGRLTE
jgi:hypothetical protein